ncbi:MAG: hypothetical protein R2685_00990 [Candidatus Nitrosocosmicus sp.]|nr:hypothetical protein [Candidatus Nitrosocosmicus sp.]
MELEKSIFLQESKPTDRDKMISENDNIVTTDFEKNKSIDELSGVNGKNPYIEEDTWTPNYLIENIFNNLMASNSRKYINQLVTKFKYFIIRSPNVYFMIEKKDLSDEVIKHLEFYVKDCKTRNEKYMKLNYIFAEVFAEIARESRPLLLAGWEDKFIELRNKEINSIRSLVSSKWKLVT